jgi:hypothetical protein
MTRADTTITARGTATKARVGAGLRWASCRPAGRINGAGAGGGVRPAIGSPGGAADHSMALGADVGACRGAAPSVVLSSHARPSPERRSGTPANPEIEPRQSPLATPPNCARPVAVGVEAAPPRDGQPPAVADPADHEPEASWIRERATRHRWAGTGARTRITDGALTSTTATWSASSWSCTSRRPTATPRPPPT